MDSGGPELMLILVVTLVLFGGQKIPELARGPGKGMREFKKSPGGYRIGILQSSGIPF
jgi:sec-independent protein translocase protein TatA